MHGTLAVSTGTGSSLSTNAQFASTKTLVEGCVGTRRSDRVRHDNGFVKCRHIGGAG